MLVASTCFSQIWAENDSKQSAAWIDRTTVSGMNILLQKTNSKVVDVVLLLKSGSGLDPAGKKGTALIMNQIVYSIVRYSSVKIGEVNVDTFPDYTVISFKTTNSGLKKALPVVYYLLSAPIYSYDSVIDLKGLYSTALKGRPPYFRAYYDFTAAFYGANHPYNDWTDPEKITAITGKEIYEWYRKTYQPGNAILSITGKVSQSIKDLNKYFADMPTESVDRRLMINAVNLEKDAQLEREDLNSRISTISIGFSAPRLWDPEYPAFRVISYYLEDYMHYFQELRVKEGLFYSGFVYYDYMEKPKAPNIAFITMTDPASVKKVCERTLAIVNGLTDQGISQSEIGQIIDSMKANQAGLPDSQRNIATRNALSQYLQTQLVYEENLMAKISQVSTEDIKKAAVKYFKNYIQVVYSPKEMAENF
jgi:predicted Zn-dependent peptidase